jgi:hypothetical protein
MELWALKIVFLYFCLIISKHSIDLNLVAYTSNISPERDVKASKALSMLNFMKDESVKVFDIFKFIGDLL